jgi:anaerobic selenocysteine-containing dehydrogenase
MAAVHKSFCRNCPAGCGIELEVEDNRIASLKGDRANPNSKGYFCVKGLSSMDLHNGQDRLLSSSIRTADGTHADRPAEAVIDDIATKLAELIERYGPRSVALYKGTGSYFNVLTLTAMTAWRHAMGSPNYFSPSTLDQSAKSVTAGRLGAFATGKRNIVNVDAMLLAGVNPLVSHSGFPGSPIPSTNPGAWLRFARQRGMKLIVVDPRLTKPRDWLIFIWRSSLAKTCRCSLD